MVQPYWFLLFLFVCFLFCLVFVVTRSPVLMLTLNLFRPVGASLREGRSPALRSPAVRLTRRGGRPASRTTRMRSRSGPGQYWERIRSNIVLERWFCLLIKCEVRQKHSNGLNIPVLQFSTVRDEKCKTFCFPGSRKEWTGARRPWVANPECLTVFTVRTTLMINRSSGKSSTRVSTFCTFFGIWGSSPKNNVYWHDIRWSRLKILSF